MKTKLFILMFALVVISLGFVSSVETYRDLNWETSNWLLPEQEINYTYLNFNNELSHANISNVDNLYDNTTNLSIAFFVKFNEIDREHKIISKYRGGANLRSWNIYIDAANRINFVVSNDTVNANDAPAPLIATSLVVFAVPELADITNTKLPLVIAVGLITLTPAEGVKIISLACVN